MKITVSLMKINLLRTKEIKARKVKGRRSNMREISTIPKEEKA